MAPPRPWLAARWITGGRRRYCPAAPRPGGTRAHAGGQSGHRLVGRTGLVLGHAVLALKRSRSRPCPPGAANWDQFEAPPLHLDLVGVVEPGQRLLEVSLSHVTPRDTPHLTRSRRSLHSYPPSHQRCPGYSSTERHEVGPLRPGMGPWGAGPVRHGSDSVGAHGSRACRHHHPARSLRAVRRAALVKRPGGHRRPHRVHVTPAPSGVEAIRIVPPAGRVGDARGPYGRLPGVRAFTAVAGLIGPFFERRRWSITRAGGRA